MRPKNKETWKDLTDSLSSARQKFRIEVKFVDYHLLVRRDAQMLMYDQDVNLAKTKKKRETKLEIDSLSVDLNNAAWYDLTN